MLGYDIKIDVYKPKRKSEEILGKVMLLFEEARKKQNDPEFIRSALNELDQRLKKNYDATKDERK